MSCQAARKAMSRSLDDELSPAERSSMEEHLARCPGCRAEHATQQRLWELLGRVEPIRPPELFAAIEARLSRPSRLAVLLDGLRLRNVGHAAAAAALVGLFVWAGAWAGSTHQRVAAASHDRSFAELLSDVPPGLEVVALLDRLGARP